MLPSTGYVMHISYFIYQTCTVSHEITREAVCKSIDIYHGKWSFTNPAPLTFRLVSLEKLEGTCPGWRWQDTTPWWCYPSPRCYTLVQSFDILLQSIVYVIQSGVRFMLFEYQAPPRFTNVRASLQKREISLVGSLM